MLSVVRPVGVVLFSWLSLTVCAAENPFVGAGACASCHPQQAKKQAGTNHAKALQPAARSVLARHLDAQPVRERNGTAFDYRVVAEGIEVTAVQDQKTAAGLLEWVFGAGALAFTPVGRHASAGYFEHRVSWYSVSQRPGMTLGHPPARPATPEIALGRRLKSDEITRCFNCHAAGVRPTSKGPDLQWMEPGVQCERCHGPGRIHVGKPSRFNISANRAPDPQAQVAFCAQCHRAPVESLGDAPEASDAMLVRFAPVGLSRSKCFRASAKMSCLTCHDPHENARHEATFYSDKCVSCHLEKRSAACAFDKQNCLSCHMPKRSPVKDLVFTDHRIRVFDRP